MKVHFNEPKEFCEELVKDHLQIERGIVRCTVRYETAKISPNIHHVIALATYSVAGQVVELEQYCGDVWRINKEEDQKVLDQADATIKLVEKFCQGCDLQVRTGHLEE